MKKRILALAALATFVAGCGSANPDTRKSKGVVEPAESTTTTMLAPSTTSTTEVTTTTTAKPVTTTTTVKPATTTTQRLTTTTTAASSSSALVFDNCTEAKAAGYRNMQRGQPGYADHLDRDQDGIACES